MIEDQTELKLESWSSRKVTWFRPEKVFSGGRKNSSFHGCDSEYFRSLQLYDECQAGLEIPRSGGEGRAEIYQADQRWESLRRSVYGTANRDGGKGPAQKGDHQIMGGRDLKRFGPSGVGGPWRVAGRGASRIGFQIRMVKRRWADD